MERNLTNQRVQSRATHITVRNSGTLNRHFVKAPRKIVFSDEFSTVSDIRTPAPASYATPAPTATTKKMTISFDSLRESLKNNATMRPTSSTQAISTPKSRPTTSRIQISAPLDISAPAPVTTPLNFSTPAPVSNPLNLSKPAPVAKPTPISIPRPLNISEPTSTPISFTSPKAPVTSAPFTKPVAPAVPAIPAAQPTPARLVRATTKPRSTVAPLQSLAERRREADTISHFSAKKLTNKSRQNSKALMSAMKEETKPKSAPIMVKKPKVSKKHLIFAVASSICCMGVLYATLKFSMPDISAKVAAAQNGASYPSFVPRDFTARSASFQKNTFSLEFVGPDKTRFTLDQEKLPWDSNALLNNYVKPTWGEQYDTIREQGLTIYMYQSNAAWVNGGTVYKLNTTSGSLSKKQLKNIITSL
jgi:PREDICTED: similar to RP4-591C20.6